MCPIDIGKVLQNQIGPDKISEYQNDDPSLSRVVLNSEG